MLGGFISSLHDHLVIPNGNRALLGSVSAHRYECSTKLFNIQFYILYLVI